MFIRHLVAAFVGTMAYDLSSSLVATGALVAIVYALAPFYNAVAWESRRFDDLITFPNGDDSLSDDDDDSLDE